MFGEYTNAGFVKTELSNIKEVPHSSTIYAKPAASEPTGQLKHICAECVICESMVGRDIGGYYLGMHWKNPVVICDWCKMCLEDRV